MPQNKKHHYVPRFYLKRFSSDGKSINIWNIRKKQKIYSANLKNQCYRDYFYGKQLELEDALGDIEGAAASVMKKAEECHMLPLPMTPEHFVLIVYLLTQFGRTKFAVSAVDETFDRLMKHIFQERAAAEKIDMEKFVIRINDAVQLSLKTYLQGYPLLLDLGYKLLVNKTNVEYVTSDNPVVFYNQFLSFRSFGGNTGLAQKGLQIFLPIGPRHVLFFYDSGTYSVGKRNTYLVNISRSRDVYEINTLQMCSALMNVYFRDSTLDIEALHRKGVPFRREKMSNLYSFPSSTEANVKNELVAISTEDIKTNLTLSFLRVKKEARAQRRRLQKLSLQPTEIPRNQNQLITYRKFLDKVKHEEYQPGDFFKYLEDISIQKNAEKS